MSHDVFWQCSVALKLVIVPFALLKDELGHILGIVCHVHVRTPARSILCKIILAETLLV